MNCKPKFAAMLVLLPLVLAAQPARVLVHPNVPPPNQMRYEDLWSVDLRNLSADALVIYLHAELSEASAGLVARANSNYFHLAAHEARSLRPRYITRVWDTWYLGGYEEFLRRAGEFPGGNYTLTITAIDSASGLELGSGSFRQNIRPVSPPRLLMPRPDDSILDLRPLCTWTPPVPVPPFSFDYYFRLVEILRDQTPQHGSMTIPRRSSTIRPGMCSLTPGPGISRSAARAGGRCSTVIRSG